MLSYIEKIKEAASLRKLPDPALLGAIRHRLFFSSYLPDILAGNEPGGAKEEALLWNRALDSVQAQDKSSLTFHLSLAKKKDPLTQACLLYAEEIASPLAAWLQTLDPINLNSLPAE